MMYYGYGSIDLKPVATWEVDGTGSVSRVPFSMYLLSGWQKIFVVFFSLSTIIYQRVSNIPFPLFLLIYMWKTKCHNSVN